MNLKLYRALRRSSKDPREEDLNLKGTKNRRRPNMKLNTWSNTR
jgi:hypothetical protein